MKSSYFFFVCLLLSLLFLHVQNCAAKSSTVLGGRPHLPPFLDVLTRSFARAGNLRNDSSFKARREVEGSCITSFSKPVDLDSCCWYSDNTCCGASTSGYEIDPPATADLKDLFDSLGATQCYLAIYDFVCMPCSPDLGSFLSINFGSQTYTARLCESLCDEIFLSCDQEIQQLLNDIHSLTLSESEFPLSQIDSSDILDGASLCKVFGEVLEDAGLPIRISMEQDNCYDGVSLRRIANSHCVVGTKDITDTLSFGSKSEGRHIDWKWIIVLVACILAGVVGLAFIVIGILWYRKNRSRNIYVREGVEIDVFSDDAADGLEVDYDVVPQEDEGEAQD